MARMEHIGGDAAAIGTDSDAEVFFRMGLSYANGRGSEPDYVTAHKWFNIAASRGDKRAAAYRSELAEEMSSHDIAAAQRAARDWLSMH